MTLVAMSHNLHSLSPLFSSTKIDSNSQMISSDSSVVRNLQHLFEKEIRIPTIKRSSHPDLQRMSSDTLMTLMNDKSINLLIIDARYPFEYSGGHIKCAKNIYTDDDIRLLFTKLISSAPRPQVIVFHCEFSSVRGPRLCRLFRSLDRQYNIADYPHLTFPSIYLLDGGYASFYSHTSSKCYCEPYAYISMFEEQYTNELRVYRHKRRVENGQICGRKLIEQQGPIQFCMS